MFGEREQHTCVEIDGSVPGILRESSVSGGCVEGDGNVPSILRERTSITAKLPVEQGSSLLPLDFVPTILTRGYHSTHVL